MKRDAVCCLGRCIVDSQRSFRRFHRHIGGLLCRAAHQEIRGITLHFLRFTRGMRHVATVRPMFNESRVRSQEARICVCASSPLKYSEKRLSQSVRSSRNSCKEVWAPSIHAFHQGVLHPILCHGLKFRDMAGPHAASPAAGVPVHAASDMIMCCMQWCRNWNLLAF